MLPRNWRRNRRVLWFAVGAAVLLLPPLLILALRVGGSGTAAPPGAGAWNACIAHTGSVDLAVWQLRAPVPHPNGELPARSILCAPLAQPEPAPGWTAVACPDCGEVGPVWVADTDLARNGSLLPEPLWGLQEPRQFSLRPPATASSAEFNPCLEWRRAAWWDGAPLYRELTDPAVSVPVGTAPYGTRLCLTGQAPQPAVAGVDLSRAVDAAHHPRLRVQTASGTYWTFARALEPEQAQAAPGNVSLLDGPLAAALSANEEWPRLQDRWVAVDAAAPLSGLPWPDGRTAWYAAPGLGMENVLLWLEWGFPFQPGTAPLRVAGQVLAVDRTDEGWRLTLRVARASPLSTP